MQHLRALAIWEQLAAHGDAGERRRAEQQAVAEWLRGQGAGD